MLELSKIYKNKKVYKNSWGKTFTGLEVLQLINYKKTLVKIKRKNEDITGVELCLIVASLNAKGSYPKITYLHSYLNYLSEKDLFPKTQDEIKNLFQVPTRLEGITSWKQLFKEDRELYFLLRLLKIQFVKPKKNETQFTKEKVLELARGYQSRTAFKKTHPGAYEMARTSSWLEEAFSHTKSNYTEEELALEAFKYRHSIDFKNYSPKHFKQAQKQKILKKITTHMINKTKWNNHEKIQKEALKYKVRREFQNKCSGAYLAAIRLGILNQVCSHMKETPQLGMNKKDLNLLDLLNSYSSYKAVSEDKNFYHQLHRMGLIGDAKAFFLDRLESLNT